MKLIPSMTPHLTMLGVLFVLALMLIVIAYAVVVHRATPLKRAHDGVLGTRLQSRIIVMFSAIAIFTDAGRRQFLHPSSISGSKSWSDTQVVTGAGELVSTARAYIEEHKGAIRNDALPSVRRCTIG